MAEHGPMGIKQPQWTISTLRMWMVQSTAWGKVAGLLFWLLRFAFGL